jgi:hypothetical protein
MIKRNAKDEEDRSYFWLILASFLGREKVNKFRIELFGEATGLHGKECEDNLISLCACLHRRWDGAGFALKPEIDSDDKLSVTFLQLKRNPKDSIRDPVPLSTRPPTEADLLVLPADNGINLLQPNSWDTPIKSGDKFSLEPKCNEPKHKHTRPSFVLLDLAFKIHKICWLAGAGDPDLLPYYDKDDPGAPLQLDQLWGLGDEEDESEDEMEAKFDKLAKGVPHFK